MTDKIGVRSYPSNIPTALLAWYEESSQLSPTQIAVFTSLSLQHFVLQQSSSLAKGEDGAHCRSLSILPLFLRKDQPTYQMRSTCWLCGFRPHLPNIYD